MPQHDEISLEFPARFAQGWNDHDSYTLMDHMVDDRTFTASAGGEIEGRRRHPGGTRGCDGKIALKNSMRKQLL